MLIRASCPNPAKSLPGKSCWTCAAKNWCTCQTAGRAEGAARPAPEVQALWSHPAINGDPKPERATQPTYGDPQRQTAPPPTP